MSKFTHEGTEALQHLAEEIAHEREQKGHTPCDDIPETDGDSPSRADAGDTASPEEEATRAEAFGSMGAPRSPGL